MMRKRSQPRITVADIGQVFSDAVVAEIVVSLKLPIGIDTGRLAVGIRRAVEEYLQASVLPSRNERHDELRKLVGAARRRDVPAVLKHLSGLSPSSRKLLADRSQFWAQGPKLPAVGELHDPTLARIACDAIQMLCCIGAVYVNGRNRPNGKRSVSAQLRLFVCEIETHPTRRDAERVFLIWMRLAWLNASGCMPPVTASRAQPGPFARLLRKCLQLLGVPHVDVVELINAGVMREPQRPGRRPVTA